ncbi:uncharacterized protein LOC123291379 [Chrysoperla carnea]|uniref:uncharacterized protein LOC123291379 n=1 Tax=Chrysoperla carnea TaxID=189513 RepID=UPI001D092CBD|nr:uncharacterized protein LOC123291379 [Chrysoperla carnea]
MSYYSTYRWCAVPECKNTSVKTPEKLWMQVPNDINMRKTWFKVARRDLELLFKKSRLYFCEDHFDLEHDMENYIQYKIMGSVKRIRLKPHCIPSRFDLNRKQKSASNESDLDEAKRQRTVQDQIKENNMKASSSCIEDSQTALDHAPSLQNKCNKAKETLVRYLW